MYIYFYSQFIVAFEDKSLILLPLDCTIISRCQHIIYSKQPRQLYSHDGRSITIYFNGGYVITTTLTSDGQLLPFTDRYVRSIGAS